LDNPDVWVVDVGDRYDPEKRNFDHHQSLDCPAAFVLVAEYLGLIETLSVMPWWNFKDSVDRIGPVKSSQIFDAGDDLVNRNPVEDWLVDRFAAEPQSSLPLLQSFGATSSKMPATSKARSISGKLPAGYNRWRPAVIGETTESYGLEEFAAMSEIRRISLFRWISVVKAGGFTAMKERP
jgi:hypothetical protein